MRMRSDHQIGAPAVESRRQLALTGAGQSLVLVSPMDEQRDVGGSVLPGRGDLAADSRRVDAVHTTPGRNGQAVRPVGIIEQRDPERSLFEHQRMPLAWRNAIGKSARMKQSGRVERIPSAPRSQM